MIGTVIDADDIAYGAQTTLETWMPSIITEIARRKDEARDTGTRFQDAAPAPVAYESLVDESVYAWALDNSPACFVVGRGISEPQRDSDGLHSGQFVIEAYAMVRGDSWSMTNALVTMYVAAMRTAIAQHGVGLSGANKPRWAGEGYNEVTDPESGRTLGAGMVRFEVKVADILDDTAGPATPPDAPEYVDPDLIPADEVIVTVDQE